MAIKAHGVKWDGITDAGIPTFMKTPLIEMGSPSIEAEKIAALRDKGVAEALRDNGVAAALRDNGVAAAFRDNGFRSN